MGLGKERGVDRYRALALKCMRWECATKERKGINKAKGLALSAKGASAIYGELWFLFWLSISLLSINCYCLLSCNASL